MKIYTICYAIAAAIISVIHIVLSITNYTPLITTPFLILFLSPLFPTFWKEISQIKFGKDGLELQRLKQETNRTIKKAAHKKSISPKEIDDLFKTVELSEWMTLVLSRMLMRQGLVCLVPDHELGASPPLEKLIALCKSRYLITQRESDELEQLRETTFYAEWWDGRIPTHAQWNWALANGKGIVTRLLEKQPIA